MRRAHRIARLLVAQSNAFLEEMLEYLVTHIGEMITYSADNKLTPQS